MNPLIDEISFDLESEFLETRKNALFRLVSMENISEPLRIQLLKKLVKHEKDPLLLEFAKEKLDKLSAIMESGMIKVKKHDDELDANDVSLDSVFNGNNKSLKMEMIGFLHSGEKKTSKFKILEYLSKQNDPDIMCGLIDLIKEIGNSNDAFTIKDYLISENTAIRRSAIDCIISLKNHECLKYVYSLILDTDDEIYNKIKQIIEKTPLNEVIEIIKPFIESNIDFELKCAIKILRLFDMRRVYKYLQKAESNFLKSQKEKKFKDQ